MWKLHIFVKSCFRILVEDRPTMEFYKLKYKKGIMYTAVGIDREIPDGQYRDMAIANKLALLDEKMAYMNMGGLFRAEIDFVGEGADKTQHYFRILFIPIFYKQMWWITTLHIISYAIIVYLTFIRFGLWEYIRKLL